MTGLLIKIQNIKTVVQQRTGKQSQVGSMILYMDSQNIMRARLFVHKQNRSPKAIPTMTIHFSKYLLLELSKALVLLREKCPEHFHRPDVINFKRHLYYGREYKKFLTTGKLEPFKKSQRKPLLDDRILDTGHNTIPDPNRKKPEQPNNQPNNIRPSNNPHLLPNFAISKPTKKNRLPQNDQNNS